MMRYLPDDDELTEAEVDELVYGLQLEVVDEQQGYLIEDDK